MPDPVLSPCTGRTRATRGQTQQGDLDLLHHLMSNSYIIPEIPDEAANPPSEAKWGLRLTVSVTPKGQRIGHAGDCVEAEHFGL